MNTKKFDAAVIGLGIGKWHLDTYIKSDKINNVFICDLKKEIEKKFLKTSKKIKILSFEEILKKKSIVFVSIASFDNYHFKQVKRSLEHNKNVFVEKPLCMNLKELKIIKKLKTKDQFLSSNLVLRTSPFFKNLKEKIKNNYFGKIFYIEGDYLWGRVEKFYGWRSKMKYYSKIYGAAVHMIDLIVWLLNEKPVSVFAIGNKIGTKSKMRFNSFVNLTLIFKKNLIVKITGNGPCVHPHYHSLKIFGDKKTIKHDFPSTVLIEKNKIKIIKLKKKIYPAKNLRSNILKTFIEGTVKKKEDFFLVSTSDVFDIMSICFAAEKSMLNGKKTKIKYA